MFVREKRINGYTYLYLVETVRENGRAKQRIIKNLGRKEALAASGTLERLASSVARYAERDMVLSQLETGNPERLACTRIGPPLLFGRLWEETGCRAVIEELSGSRKHGFAVERAVFLTVLHRLFGLRVPDLAAWSAEAPSVPALAAARPPLDAADVIWIENPQE